jgi:hypothetical protein
MDIIEQYGESQNNMVYMAKPVYGGWVTFTAHMALKYDYDLYKIGKRTEKNKRDYGYGVQYQNLCITDIVKLPNLFITAIDKHYYEYLEHFPEGTTIVIHDPTELKAKDSPILKYKDKLRFITIRETVQEFLRKGYGIQSTFKIHPFYGYERGDACEDIKCVSISRIDFDKNTDILLKANMKLPKELQIALFGAENRLYVHHKLQTLNIGEHWKGKFKKSYPLVHDGKDILRGAKYMIDMSTIKNDGGGTQYTFLEAIHNGCVLILNEDWVKRGRTFIDGKNCISVRGEDDIVKILTEDKDYSKIIIESQKLLKRHIDVLW